MIDWAMRWNIPIEAIHDLIATLAPTTGGYGGGAEAAVQQAVRMEASRAGGRLWRNNLGAVKMPDGGYLRYGLANDSTAMNKRLKSSDLVGIRPVLITQHMVGRTIGQFMAREIKRPGWEFRGDARERAQLAFLTLIYALGGDACFANSTGTIM